MKPYIKRSIRKTKKGWSASVYILAHVSEKKTKRQAMNELSWLVWEMECNNKKCCKPIAWSVGNTSGSFANAVQFLVSTK